MKVLVVGRGGREHSIVLNLKKDERIKNIFVAPGNGGIEEDAECLPIDEMAIDQLIAFAKKEAIDLTIVGPENPLNEGIANRFHEEGLAIFAPTKEAALLEGSKSFAKAFMKRHHIPTAKYETFTDAHLAKQYIKQEGAPIVIKADGLAADKNVVVAETEEEALQAVDDMLIDKAFSDASAKIVVEEFLAGEEFSLMAFVHKNTVYPMVTARDHKRAFDHDEGPNTGGMGAYAPVEVVSNKVLTKAIEETLQRAADGLVAENRSFTGILYAGLMMTDEGAKVIEYNTRFGDPETQVVLPLLENSLLQVMQQMLAEENPHIKWRSDSCLGVVVAAKGYPGTCDSGVSLPVPVSTENLFTIHAGTKKAEDGYVSNGGRLLLVGSTGKTINDARQVVYEQLNIYDQSDAFFFRRDIGIK